MKDMLTKVSLSVVLFGVGLPLWAQADATGVSAGAPADSVPMSTPAPLSGQNYSMDFSSETQRSNYVRGGLTFGAAYDDNVQTNSSGNALSDVSYSVSPTIALDITRSRLTWNVVYSPGFTFYQKYSGLNQSNENVATRFSYRLTPHVTFSAQEAFAKTAGTLNQPCQTDAASSCGTVDSPNSSIIAPIADTLTDSSNAQLSYQFSPGGMVGLTGDFSVLHYPNAAQVPGLYGSSTTGGGAFYTHRLSGKHYIGATYQYQRYLTHPDGLFTQPGLATQAQSLMLFYTLYLQKTISFSLFGGPQYTLSSGGFLPQFHSWSPGGGASLNWQGQHNSLLVSYNRKISDGGGLQGAVSYNGADLSLRHQFSAAWNGGVGADYAVNKILDPLVLGGVGGHTLSGNVSLQRTFGEHFYAMAGYLRSHQSYSGITAIAIAPDRDRVWLSLGYQFQRPLGR
jgi:hypothetical protein